MIRSTMLYRSWKAQIEIFRKNSGQDLLKEIPLDRLCSVMTRLYRVSGLDVVRSARLEYILSLPKSSLPSAFASCIEASCTTENASGDGLAILSEMHLMGIPCDESSCLGLLHELSQKGDWKKCLSLYDYYLDSGNKFSERVFGKICDVSIKTGRWEVAAMALLDLWRDDLHKTLSESALCKSMHASVTRSGSWYSAMTYMIPWFVKKLSKNPSQKLFHELIMSAYSFRRKCSPAWLEKVIRTSNITLTPLNLNLAVQLYSEDWKRALDIYESSKLHGSLKESGFISLMRILSSAGQWTASVKVFRKIGEVPSLIHRLNVANSLAYNGKWELALSEEIGIAPIFLSFQKHLKARPDIMDERTGAPAGLRSLVYTLSKENRWHEAFKIFDRSSSSTAASQSKDLAQSSHLFTSREIRFLLNCCIRCSRLSQALQVYERLSSRMKTNPQILTLMLDGCINQRTSVSFRESIEALCKNIQSLNEFDLLSTWKLLFLILMVKPSPHTARILDSIACVATSTHAVEEFRRSEPTKTSSDLAFALRKMTEQVYVPLAKKVTQYVYDALQKCEPKLRCQKSEIASYFFVPKNFHV